MNSDLVPDGHLFKIGVRAPVPTASAPRRYSLVDSTDRRAALRRRDATSTAQGIGPVGAGLLPIVLDASARSTVDRARTGFAAGEPHQRAARASPTSRSCSINLRRPGYPDDLAIAFADAVRRHRRVAHVAVRPARPAKFTRLRAHRRAETASSTSASATSTATARLSQRGRIIDIVTYHAERPRRRRSPRGASQLDRRARDRGRDRRPAPGDVYELELDAALRAPTTCSCSTTPRRARSIAARPRRHAEPSPTSCRTPTSASASFEPARFAVSGRGERRIEFRGLPQNASIRIYTVRGDLVQTLRQDGSTDGFVPWDLRTKDNLDVAPGLYIFHVEAPERGHAHRQVRGHQMSARAYEAALTAPASIGRRRWRRLVAGRRARQTKTGTTHRPVPRHRAERAHRGDGQRRRRARRRDRGASTTTRPRSAALERSEVQFTHGEWFAGHHATTTSRPRFPFRQLGHVLRAASPRSARATSTCAPWSSRSGTGERYTRLRPGARARLRAADHRSLRGRAAAQLRAGDDLAQLGRACSPSASARSTGSPRAGSASARASRTSARRRATTAATCASRTTTIRTAYGDNGALPAEQFTDDFPVPILFRVGRERIRYRLTRGQRGCCSRSTRSIPSDNTESVSVGAEWRAQQRARAARRLPEPVPGGLRGRAHARAPASAARLGPIASTSTTRWADHGRLEDTHRMTFGVDF